MNFILTYNCPSGCSYCFMPKRNGGVDMPFETFKRLLDHTAVLYKGKRLPSVGLLGGEPLSVKDFPFIAAYASAYKGGVKLYTSLNAGTENLPFIKPNMRILWNNFHSKDNPNSREHKNLKTLLKKIAPEMFTSSVTISKGSVPEDYKYLINNFKGYAIDKVRLALDVKNHKHFINDKSIFEIINYLLENGLKVNFVNCGHMLKCMFSAKERKKLSARTLNFNFNDCSKNLPVDVLPSGKVVPCMPYVNVKSNINFLDYKNFSSLKKALKETFFTKANYCKNCKDYQKTCGGICLK
jgi:radical SAM protein with 4Fe4S-binding SPASM domain